MHLRRTAILAALASTTLAAPAIAWGPGVHAREAAETARQLVERDPAWAAVFDDPIAEDALVLGAITPDFRQVIDNLPFGHDRRLGYHLIDAAAGGTAEQRAFALGFLAHVVSDNSADTFVAPGLWVMHALGPFDLVADPRESLISETELLCETFGDLVLGEWDDVVDALFTYRFDGPEARARLDAVIVWYCGEANAFTGLDADCEAAAAELDALLTRGDSLLGGVDRDGAQDLLDALIDHPPADLVPVFSGGAISSLLGDAFTFSDHYAYEIARFEASPLVDEAFWALYDSEWADLAPHLTITQLDRRANGWPTRDNDTLRGANWISTYRHLDPAWWGDGAGLVVKNLAWRVDGEVASTVRADAGAVNGEVTVRFFATRPVIGTVSATVRTDAIGFGSVTPDARGDAMGDASMVVDLDPRRAVDEGVNELVVPFTTADLDGVDGWVVDVAFDDRRPFFTSQTEPLFSDAFVTEIGVPMWQPAVREAFSPSAAWPGALRVDRPDALAELHVFARIGPDREGLAEVRIDVDGAVATTRDDGLAVFDAMPSGEVTIAASAAGFDDATMDVTIAGGRTSVDVFLRPRLDPTTAPIVCDPACIDVIWAADRQGAAPERVFGMVEQDGAALHEPVYLGRDGAGTLCLPEPLPTDGPLVVATRTGPVGGEPGPWDRSDPFRVDPEDDACLAPDDVGVDGGADAGDAGDPSPDVGAPDVGGDTDPADAGADTDTEGTDTAGGDDTRTDAASDAPDDAADAEGATSSGGSGGGCAAADDRRAPAAGGLVLAALGFTRRRRRRA